MAWQAAPGNTGSDAASELIWAAGCGSDCMQDLDRGRRQPPQHHFVEKDDNAP
jgi:hypothetical protein